MNLTIHKDDVNQLLQAIREPLPCQVYLLLLVNCDAGGLVKTSYASLIDLCTPPRPERGRSLPKPSMHQMRRAVGLLEAANMVYRNAEQNITTGHLWLMVHRHKP